MSRGLAVRSSATDDGERPLAACGTPWRSPELWIDHRGATEVNALSGSAADGVLNIVTVRVTNTSSDVVYHDINVEAWICRLGTGPDGPATQIPSAGSGPRTGFHRGPLAPGESLEIACEPPWQPVAGEGPVCLVANCWAEDPLDGHPLATELDFCGNAHHARRGVAVMPVWWFTPAPDDPRPQGFTGAFLAVNPDSLLPRQFTMQLTPIDPQELSGGDRDLLKPYIPNGWYEPLWPAAWLDYDLRDGSTVGREIDITLAPGEQRPFQVVVTRSTRQAPGTNARQDALRNPVNLFDVVQRDSRGVARGGFRLLVPHIW